MEMHLPDDLKQNFSPSKCRISQANPVLFCLLEAQGDCPLDLVEERPPAHMATFEPITLDSMVLGERIVHTTLLSREFYRTCLAAAGDPGTCDTQHQGPWRF